VRCERNGIGAYVDAKKSGRVKTNGAPRLEGWRTEEGQTRAAPSASEARVVVGALVQQERLSHPALLESSRSYVALV
jgi:hypothetical protein